MATNQIKQEAFPWAAPALGRFLAQVEMLKAEQLRQQAAGQAADPTPPPPLQQGVAMGDGAGAGKGKKRKKTGTNSLPGAGEAGAADTPGKGKKKKSDRWELALGDDIGTLPAFFLAGETMHMDCTWGCDVDGNMTEPTTVAVHFTENVSAVTAIQMLMDAYAATVHTPRFYFVERIVPAAGGGHTLCWGT